MTNTSLVKSLSVQWDLRLGPYRAFFPSEEEDIQRCIDFSKNELYQQEFSNKKDEEGEKIIRQLAACEDTRNGKLVATLFLEDALQMRNSEKKSKLYNLHQFSKEQLSKIAILSHLSLDAVKEKTSVAQVFLSHCFIEILKAGGQAMLISCDVGYFSLYKRLGMRPIGALSKAEGEPFIPMIFLPDRDYLMLIHSPVLNSLRGANFSKLQPICDWYYHLLKEKSELQIGSAFYPENEEGYAGHEAITEGLSEKGLETFLDKAMIVKCREDEVLISDNDAGNSFGFIQKGIVKVVIRGRTLVVLGEGDIFGEIAFILGTKRTAQVIAASRDTEIVLFNSDAIDALKNESDKLVIWQNLSRILAQRVVLTNRLL